MANNSDSTGISEESLMTIQNIMGYSDEEFTEFKNQPRTPRIVSRFEDILAVNVIFEVKESRGCVIGHKKGDYFLFPRGGAMDTRNSSPKLCPFLMPPMTRILWLLQERVWEGLHPLPLFATGHCDDVGLECGGWGKVVIEARIVEQSELASFAETG